MLLLATPSPCPLYFYFSLTIFQYISHNGRIAQRVAILVLEFGYYEMLFSWEEINEFFFDLPFKL